MVGQTVGHYRIVDRLGAGGMGVVYKAEDLQLGRAVALKFLSPELSSSPIAVERFMREARTASSLNHPNICTIYSIEECEGQRFLAMELLEGQSLQEVIGGKPLPPDTVIDLGLQIADALDAAHAQGVLHRDIKPANIFVTRRHLVKVLDFGLAKLALLARDSDARDSSPTMADVMLTTQGLALGTVAYMSPEQARGEPLDARSDIFSFGIVLYEMLTGQQAFPGRTSAVVFDAILNRDPPVPSLFQEHVPEELEHIIEQALDKDPVGRFQSMAELRSELARLKRQRESGQVLAASSAGVPAAATELSDDDTPTLLVRRPPSGGASSRVPAVPRVSSTGNAAGPPPPSSAAPEQVAPDPARAGTSATAVVARGVHAGTGVESAGAAPAIAPAAPVAPVRPGRNPAATKPAAGRRGGVAGKAAAGVAACLVIGALGVWALNRRAGGETPAEGSVPAPTVAPVPQPLTSDAAARQAIAAVAPGAQPADVSATGVPIRTPRSPTPRPVAPAAPPTPKTTPIAGSAIIPALPKASPQRVVDPSGLLLSAARTKYDTRLYDEALADLETIVRDHPSSAAVPGALLLRARIDSQQGRVDPAIDALSRLRTDFGGNAANAEGSVLLGQLLERSKRPDRVATARQVLGEVPQRFPDSPWAPRALAQRALLETRERVRVADPELGSVPAAFLSNRQLVEKYPSAPEAELAWWQVASEYEGRKAWAQAASGFAELATRFPQTRYDAWWKAAEIYDKRLRDRGAAQAAYAKVPPASPKYRDAQKRARER